MADTRADELGDWQELFEREYVRCQQGRRAALGGAEQPVLLRLDDNLVLCFNRQQSAWLINSDKFHWYKRAAHFPVAAGLALVNAETPDELRQVANHLSGLVATMPKSDGLDVTAGALRELLKKVGQSDSLPSEALRSFAERCMPVSGQLAHSAARLELDALNQAMEQMAAQVGDDAKWLRSYVVICAGHQPRYKQLSKQFFQRYFAARPGARGEAGHQIIYGEGIGDVEAALDLVATRMADKWVGEVFIGDSRGMEQDVLGDAGERLLGDGAGNGAQS